MATKARTALSQSYCIPFVVATHSIIVPEVTIDMLLAQEQPAVRTLARNADGSFAAVCRRLRPLKA